MSEAVRSEPAINVLSPARRGQWVLVLSLVYALVVLSVLALIHWVGEDWWGVTVLLFIPRWLFLGPILLLMFASACLGRRAHWATQAAIALVIAGPLMGISLPMRQLWTSPVEGPTYRLLSYNLASGRIATDRFVEMIEREQIDLLTFQEGRHGSVALNAYLANGWYHDREGYVASRYPIVAELDPLPDSWTTDGRHSARLTRVRIRPPVGPEFILACVHMPTIRPGLNRFFAGDIHGLELHVDWWVKEMDRVAQALAESHNTPFLVAGDFNMPPDESTMFSLRTVLRSAFEEAGWGYGYTRPARLPWFRIDHILTSPEWEVTRCWVGPDFGSDHLPILAEVRLPEGLKGAPTPRDPGRK
jgi:endonuclease/exonuclease/phosphatase (EEP) superfamily protein YafD